LRELFVVEVLPECRLSLSAIISAASSALSVFAVLDEPDCRVGESPGLVVLRTTQPEARSFASTRHSFLISLIEARVV
jgi:hypothetical protein